MVAGLLALPLLATVACSEPLRPGDVAGVYALQRVGGEPLPTVLYANDYARVHVLADTLRFSADGSGLRTSVLTVEPLKATLAPSGGEPTHRSFYFRIVGGRIEIGLDCPPNANCVAPPHLVGLRTHNGLRVSEFGGNAPLLYARIDGRRM
jgi:hypothetical protein